MQVGTPNFDSYTRTLRRVFQAEIVDLQLRLAREVRFRASLVRSPYGDHLGATAIAGHVSREQLSKIET